MLRGIFVTGTDTNVGKTVVSAALLRRYASPSLRYWKPVQTGIEQDDDTAVVRWLSGSPPERMLDAGVRLRRPVSPHLAARLSGTAIDVESLVATTAAQAARDRFVVEGAGGVLVPLNERTTMIDFIARLKLPVLIVTRSSLGTINHTLLTIEALDRRAIPVAGLVMVGQPDEENRRALECYGRVPVVGELPMLDPLSPLTLGQWAAGSLDAAGRLTEFFQ